MAPFQYAPWVNPYIPTIGELIAHRSDAAAHAAETIGAANARAAEISGNAWSRAAEGIAGSVTGAIQQANDPRRKLEALQLQDAQDRRRGQTALDTMMAGDTRQPGETGAAPDSYLTSDGLFDVPKLNQALGGMGLAHVAPDLLKGAEGINDSIVKHQQLEQQADNQHTIMLGDLADGAMKLSTKLNVPLTQAMDFVVQPALARKRIQPDEYARVKEQIAALPPEQQGPALSTFMDQAAKLDKGETLAEGAQRVDRYGRVVATGAPKPLTPEQVALDAATVGTPQETPTAKQSAAAVALTHQKNPPTLDEQLLTAKAAGDKVSEARILATFKDAAAAKRDPVAAAQLEAIRNLSQREAQQRLDDANPQSPKNQQKFEQEYRNVLQRAMSSRSGGVGLEDQKVQQANHLMTIFEQNFDPKTGEWNIPRVQLNELALGLARLTAPGGQAGEAMLKEFQQRTAKGDLAGALTYLTGQPIAANTQGITQMLKDSIERQGRTAEQNREGEMNYLRGLAPTDLAEPRRKSLEATSLNPLRQSKVLLNEKGERRLVYSVDGGATWR